MWEMHEGPHGRMLRSSAAIRDSSSTAVRVWPSACVVESAAVETLVMFSAI
jgi:hypothetical protein